MFARSEISVRHPELAEVFVSASRLYRLERTSFAATAI